MPTTHDSTRSLRAIRLRRAFALATVAVPLLSLWPGCAASDDSSDDADSGIASADSSTGDGSLDGRVTDATFDVSFDTSLESSVDAGHDAAMDSAHEADAPADAPDDTIESPDIVADVVADVTEDVAPDAIEDAPADVVDDVVADAGVDAAEDAPDDVQVDASTDARTDGGMCTIGHVVLSEVRSRGAGGAADEFIELFNATDVAVTLDNTWSIKGRSTTSTTYTSRWTGSGLVVPAWGHFLIGGTSYTETPAADSSLSSGITDASSLELVQSGTTVDAVCYYFDSTTLAAFDATYTCEGTPVSNLPHDNTTAGASDSDSSIERAPGGTGGNCTDTGNNSADFVTQAPATPQSTTSAPTP
jgi:hypothetical protein